MTRADIPGLAAGAMILLAFSICAFSHQPSPLADPAGLPPCVEVTIPERGTFCPKPRMDYLVDQMNMARVNAQRCAEIEMERP